MPEPVTTTKHTYRVRPGRRARRYNPDKSKLKPLVEFRAFLLRDKLIELAVAVVIGTAFTALVKSFVADVITPLIALFGGRHDYSDLVLSFHGAHFRYGDLINATISFVIVATVVFFFVVRPAAILKRRLVVIPEVKPMTRLCPECLADIPALARRCQFCASPSPPAVDVPVVVAPPPP